jgi:thiol-disulfide isomerase/thioredoxin
MVVMHKSWVGLFALGMIGCSSNPPSGGNDSGSMNGNDAGMSEPDAMDQPDEGPPPCEYPPGPYGYQVGKVVPPNQSWDGYAPGSSTVETFKASDFYDCDGRFGINAILFDEAALWCGPCQQEASNIPDYYNSTAKPNGIKIVTLVVEDLKMQPATTANALTWRNQFKLYDIHVLADPGYFFSTPSGTNGLPTNVIVDPRTMKITKIVQGWSGMIEPEVLALAQKNKTM